MGIAEKAGLIVALKHLLADQPKAPAGTA